MEMVMLVLAAVAAVCSAAALLIALRRKSGSAAPIEKLKIEETVRGENKRLCETFQSLLSMQGEAIKDGLVQTGNFQKERLERLEASVRELMNSTEQRMQNLSRAVGEDLRVLREENAKQLKEMREVVDEKLNTTLKQRFDQSFQTIHDTLDNVYKGLTEMHTLTASVGDLSKVLSNVKTRGMWGEVQLNALLSQMLNGSQYLTNVAVDKMANERVEFAVKLPGRDDGAVLLPIDAKFPLDQYQKLVDAGENMDKALVERYSKELETAVKEQAKKISGKYIAPPVTTDFAIMYLPLESLYAEVVKRPGLCESLQRDYRIMVCGPSTLGALLNSLQLGFKTVAIEKRGAELWKLLSAFKVEFSRFTDTLERSKKKLEEASKTLDDATTKTQRIQKKLSSVEVISEIEAERYLEIDNE